MEAPAEAIAVLSRQDSEPGAQPAPGRAASTMRFQVALGRSAEEFVALGPEWDRLLASSATNSVFLTSAWLRAWLDTYMRGVAILVPQVWCDGTLVAAAAFQVGRGVVEFIGKGRSDYLDVLMHSSLNAEEAAFATASLLDAVRIATPGFRRFVLQRIPVESGTMARLLHLHPQYLTIRQGSEVAPTMDMSAAPEALRKKSLRRHERGLQRLGSLQIDTFTRADDILPRLDTFFDQHVRRRAATDHPSLFLKEANREFYRCVTRNLDHSGVLRYTEVHLAERLVATHFGFFDGTRFTWYKPAFDPDLAQHSPGEVLLKVLIERAVVEGAAEFDFTIGDEAFKSRFATRVREIAQLHVTDSRMLDWGLRLRMGGTRALRSLIGTTRFNQLRRLGRRW